jgi:hypothetical protein
MGYLERTRRAILAVLADGRTMTCREIIEVTDFNLIPRAD